jgi:dihydrofolate reductase
MTSNPQGPKPRVSIIVAMAKNRVIGADNKLPWHLSADLKRFKALTMGHHIIMGRKTFESIGRILPGRTSVVVTRNPALRADGVVVVNDMESALAKCTGDTEAFVIGGEGIFQSALPLADRIYLTEIDKHFEGDVHFPAIDMQDWRLIERKLSRDETQNLDHVFEIWERVALSEVRKT